MIDQLQDSRVIEPTAEKYNATLVRREDENDSLARFWVRTDGPIPDFIPGQYMTIGVYADDKLYQRPYSVASSPQATGEEGFEFYVRLVPVLRFTTLLWRLPVGHEMRMIGPKGRFMLEPDDERTHLFISTGTGIAPFIAMTRQLLHDGHLEHVRQQRQHERRVGDHTAVALARQQRAQPRRRRRCPTPPQ